jgi:hypothetical protein
MAQSLVNWTIRERAIIIVQRLLAYEVDGLNKAEARESASWRNSEIYLIERWTEERAGRGEVFARDRLYEFFDLTGITGQYHQHGPFDQN